MSEYKFLYWDDAGDTQSEVDNQAVDTIAVYGTLKRGHGNHGFLSGSSVKFLGNGVTEKKYRLCISSLPYLLEGESNSGYNVKVEVYKVDSRTFRKIDMLEGHPHFYKREKTTVRLSNNNFVDCWVYFVKDVNAYDNMVYHEEY